MSIYMMTLAYMIGGSEGAVRSPDLTAGNFETLESLLRPRLVGSC